VRNIQSFLKREISSFGMSKHRRGRKIKQVLVLDYFSDYSSRKSGLDSLVKASTRMTRTSGS
jgi:hypothetical protein